MLSLLKDNPKLVEQLRDAMEHFDIEAKLNKSIVFTYAITIAFKKYDRQFISDLTNALQSKFNVMGFSMNHDAQNEKIINLQYLNQSFLYYIPYMVLYFLLFLYIYISVRKIEFVKSKWGLAFAAVSQVRILVFYLRLNAQNGSFTK